MFFNLKIYFIEMRNLIFCYSHKIFLVINNQNQPKPTLTQKGIYYKKIRVSRNQMQKCNQDLDMG